MYILEGAHDAAIDVKASLNLYLKLKAGQYGTLMNETNPLVLFGVY